MAGESIAEGSRLPATGSRRTRQAGCGSRGPTKALRAFAHLEPREPRHAHGAADALARLGEYLGHRGLGVANARLFGEHGGLVEAAQLAFDDLVDHVGRLAAVLHLRAIDRL